MRSLFLLLFGAFCGVLATVLFFSLDTDFEGDPDDSAGGGNARIVFDEPGLEAIIEKELPNVEGLTDIAGVSVTVQEEGTIRVKITYVVPGAGLSGDVIADPNVVDGRLKVDVVHAGVGRVGVPGPIAGIIERELQQSLDALDPDRDYRLVSITTTNHELTLEVEL